MKKYFQTFILAIFVLFQFLGLAVFISPQVAIADLPPCTVLIVFDVKPNPSKAESMLTLSGSVAFSEDGKNIGGNCRPVQANFVEIWRDNAGSLDDSIAQFEIYAKLTQDMSKKVDFSANWTPSNYGHKNGSSVSFYATVSSQTGRSTPSYTKSSTVTVTLSANASTPPVTNPATAGKACTGTGQGTCASGLSCVSSVCQASGTTPPADNQTPPPGGMQSQPAPTLINPIEGASNLTELLLKIMRGFIYITGIWAVAFIVIGGFKMVISQGNEEAVTAAKKTITWAVIGLVVVLLAFSIIAIVQNLIGIDVKDVKTSQNYIYQQTQKL